MHISPFLHRLHPVLWEDVKKSRPLCVVMSPTHGRLLDLAVEIATAQMWNGRHFVSITPTTALRFVRGVHTATADGCTRCAVTDHLVTAGWQFVTTLPSLARKMQRRCAGGHLHVQRTPASDACTNAKSHRNEHPTMQRQVGSCSVCGSSRRHKGEEESGDIFGRPHSSVQTSLRRLHVNLGHPKNNVLIRHLKGCARDATNSGSCTKLRMPCMRIYQIPSSRTTVLSDRSPTSSQKHCDGCEGNAGVDTGGSGKNSACGVRGAAPCTR